MAKSRQQREAEKLAARHGIDADLVQQLLDYWVEIRGFGSLDRDSVRKMETLVRQAEAIRERARTSDHVRHAMEAHDALGAVEDLPELLRHIAQEERPPGRGSAVRADELLLAWSATDIWRWCRPEEAARAQWKEVPSVQEDDHGTSVPGNAYTEWIIDLLLEAGVQRSARQVLRRLREVQQLAGEGRVPSEQSLSNLDLDIPWDDDSDR